MVLTILLLYIPSRIFTRSCEKGPGNGTILTNGKAISRIPFRTEKRTTSGGCPQFPKRFSGKLPFHLTSNRNVRIFWLNGKHPRTQFVSNKIQKSHGVDISRVHTWTLVLHEFFNHCSFPNEAASIISRNPFVLSTK